MKAPQEDTREYREFHYKNAVVRVYGKGPSREELEDACREYWTNVYKYWRERDGKVDANR